MQDAQKQQQLLESEAECRAVKHELLKTQRELAMTKQVSLQCIVHIQVYIARQDDSERCDVWFCMIAEARGSGESLHGLSTKVPRGRHARDGVRGSAAACSASMT